MTAITATPNAATASILLEMTGLPDGPVTLLRVDVNGVAAVRLLFGQVPVAGVMTVTDWEVAIGGGPVRYDLFDAVDAWASVSTSLDVAVPWLTAPVLPAAYSLALTAITGFDATRPMSTTIHTVVDRPDPVVTMGRQGLRTGTMTAWAPTYQAARAIEAIADRGEVLLLRQGDYPGMDMYFVASATRVNPEAPSTPRRWSVALTYIEVAIPTGPLLAVSSWTYADLAEDLDSFAWVFSTYPTFADVLANTP